MSQGRSLGTTESRSQGVEKENLEGEGQGLKPPLEDRLFHSRPKYQGLDSLGWRWKIVDNSVDSVEWFNH